MPTRSRSSVNDRDPKVFDLYTVGLSTGVRTLAALNDPGFGDFTLDRQLRVRFATKKLPDPVPTFVTDLVKKPPADGKRTDVFDTIPFEDAETSGASIAQACVRQLIRARTTPARWSLVDIALTLPCDCYVFQIGEQRQRSSL